MVAQISMIMVEATRSGQVCVSLGLGGPPVSLPTQLKDSLGHSPVADTEPSTLFYMLN